LYNKDKKIFERGTPMSAIFFEILGAGGLSAALNLITEKLGSVATTVNVPAIAAYALGAVIAVLVGVFGYKYIKLLSAACFAVAGYGIGDALFNLVNTKFNLNLPAFVGIIAGVVLLAVLGFLAYKKVAYALFGVACFAGFVVAYFIYPNYLIALAIGVVVAFAAMYSIRTTFVAITSFAGGVTLIAMLSAIAPDVTQLRLGEGNIGKIIAIAAAFAFSALQYRITKGKKGSKGTKNDNILTGSKLVKTLGPKRVKIRRVFDGW
jgi:hypothetical protein